MVRKAANARERFGKAAMELFRERGYTETTVPQIAAAAGLTERTFFRYFVDKPEVLFWRASELQSEIVDAIRRAPNSAKPLEAAVGALEQVGRFFDANREDVVVRQAVVAAHPNFQEREMMKMRSLASAIADELEDRGTPACAARMAAEVGVAILRVAIERWSSNEKIRSFSHYVQESLDDLITVVGDESRSASRSAQLRPKVKGTRKPRHTKQPVTFRPKPTG